MPGCRYPFPVGGSSPPDGLLHHACIQFILLIVASGLRARASASRLSGQHTITTAAAAPSNTILQTPCTMAASNSSVGIKAALLLTWLITLSGGVVLIGAVGALSSDAGSPFPADYKLAWTAM